MAMGTAAENLTGSSMTEIRAVADALRAAKRVSAICHENPDADTIGAAIAVRLIAERLGAEAEVVSADGIPPVFAFLPGIGDIRPRPALQPDLAVICDAATLERVGGVAREEADWFSRATLVNIDHHISNNGFGHLNLVDPQAAATCQVIAERLLPALDLAPDASIATALLAGIVRDTQGFSDQSTSAATLRAAALLVEAGAPLAAIQRKIMGDYPYPMMALWGRLLATMDELLGGRIVHTTLTPEMLAQTGAAQHHADGIAEFMGNVQGAQVAILFRELGPASTRVSLRTSADVDATHIAARFGGGGHARRAGGQLALPVDRVREDLLRISQEILSGKG
jgi:bifunctional oligoribonuclease and PAP phosphatase NrnA